MQTYTETVGRYVILKHDDLPEEHKAAYRADGIDPDTIWSLHYSTNDAARAQEMLAYFNDDAARWESFKLEDRGAATTIERPVY
jgi:hypothetical protein